MTARNHALRVLVLVTLAFAAALAWQRPAFAGTLQIRDEAHVLTAAGTEQLRSTVASAPFDARLVFTTEYADAQELSRFVGSLVDEPNMVTVGVDPRHRHVQVHFGRGAGIARPEWPAIETAGNGSFREGNWVDGAAAIFRTAAHSVTGVTGVTGNPATTATGGHAPGVASVLLVLLVVGGAAAAVGLLARRRFMGGPPGAPGYGGPGYGGPGYGYGGGPYGGPPPGGMGPLGGGVIGAGIGGIAGYELGKLEGEREQRDRGYDDTARQAPDDDFDAGGGGSSWDGGGGGNDSGGFDGGGDGGGGSDF